VTLPLRVALDQCLRHASLMKSALADLPNPLDAGALAADEDFLIRAIDQFVLRFIKLQDTLGVVAGLNLSSFSRSERACSS
jgi:hypothetical protein